MYEVKPVNAVNFLLNGALGVGEEHGDPAARRFVIELIEKGVVTKLFLELPKNMARFSEKMAEANAAAAAGRTMEEIAAVAPSGDLDIGNEYPLNRLIAFALSKGIEVYLADDRTMARSGGGNFDKRHKSIRDTFNEATGQNDAKWFTSAAKGSLFLWGGAHFDDPIKKNLNSKNYINGLPWVKKG